MDIPAALYWVLGAVIALQVWILFVIAGISRRVDRLARGGDEAKSPSRRRSSSRNQEEVTEKEANDSRFESPSSPVSENSFETDERAETEQGRHFAEFLNEDPSRMELPKKEQFAAFRSWRAAKGLNWRGS
jgi:cytoskeletal protein RodZ